MKIIDVGFTLCFVSELLRIQRQFFSSFTILCLKKGNHTKNKPGDHMKQAQRKKRNTTWQKVAESNKSIAEKEEK